MAPTSQRANPGISAISVRGFKSLYRESRIEIRPLTILAGANSSGKSSIMQPLLLLKQTFEASYDACPLKLDGPNISFTKVDQLLSVPGDGGRAIDFTLALEADGSRCLTETFKRSDQFGVDIAEMTYREKSEHLRLVPAMSEKAVSDALPPTLRNAFGAGVADWNFGVGRMRSFLGLRYSLRSAPGFEDTIAWTGPFASRIAGTIHVPALRGNPARAYKTTVVGSEFPGTFETYVASIVHRWQTDSDRRLRSVGTALHTLGLGSQVVTTRIDDTQVELHVGRGTIRGLRPSPYLINIADVGFGVSQVLPV